MAAKWLKDRSWSMCQSRLVEGFNDKGPSFKEVLLCLGLFLLFVAIICMLGGGVLALCLDGDPTMLGVGLTCLGWIALLLLTRSGRGLPQD